MRAISIPVSTALIESVFLHGIDKTISKLNGLPDNARISGYWHDVSSDILYIRLESDAFKEIQMGTTTPVIDCYADYDQSANHWEMYIQDSSLEKVLDKKE